MMLSFTPMIFDNYASAANFLPNAFYNNPAQGGFDTVNETIRSQNAAYLLSSRYGSNNCFQRINASATKSGYQNTLNTVKSYDKAVVFSKGHRTIINNHPGLIPNHNQNAQFGPDFYLLDYEIYPYTSTKNVVTFIWHCQTAYNYTGNGVIPSLGGCVFGLPYCFTHNPSMQRYGSSGSQVYLGWEDKSNFYIQWPDGTQTYRPTVGSPNYEWKMNANNDFGRVAELYWYYMCQGYTSYSALNQISNSIYTTGFMTGYMYNWLIIYGNQAMVLPY